MIYKQNKNTSKATENKRPQNSELMNIIPKMKKFTRELQEHP
jgi:hypothetical protein